MTRESGVGWSGPLQNHFPARGWMDKAGPIPAPNKERLVPPRFKARGLPRRFR
jgi:hypothetical protein